MEADESRRGMRAGWEKGSNTFRGGVGRNAVVRSKITLDSILS